MTSDGKETEKKTSKVAENKTSDAKEKIEEKKTSEVADKKANLITEKKTSTDKKTDAVKRKSKTTTASKTVKGNEYRSIIAVIVIAVILILSLIGGTVVYFLNHADDSTNVNNNATTSATTAKTGNMPANPNTAAVKWLESLMDETAKKFPSDTFTNGNETLNAIIAGDYSKIPDSIKDKVEHGSNTTGITIGREVLDGASYVGLMVFSNAYSATKEKGTQLSGDSLVSYNTETNTVYIPAQAIIATDKNMMFEVRWTGSEWKLEGDPLGWQTYVMLQQQAEANNSSSDNSNAN